MAEVVARSCDGDSDANDINAKTEKKRPPSNSSRSIAKSGKLAASIELLLQVRATFCITSRLSSYSPVVIESLIESMTM